MAFSSSLGFAFGFSLFHQRGEGGTRDSLQAGEQGFQLAVLLDCRLIERSGFWAEPEVDGFGLGFIG